MQHKDGPKNPIGWNEEHCFRWQIRKNETHASTTDLDARLYKKSAGREALTSYLGHALMENKNGLIIDGSITHATGTAEREAAVEMASDVARKRRITVGGDKGYDTNDFVDEL